MKTIPGKNDVTMRIGILTLQIAMPGCSSLKEKRQRMGGMHERYGRNPAVAVFESGGADRQDMAEWSFVVVGSTPQKVESLCSEIEDKVQRGVDGRVMDVSREIL